MKLKQIGYMLLLIGIPVLTTGATFPVTRGLMRIYHLGDSQVFGISLYWWVASILLLAFWDFGRGYLIAAYGCAVAAFALGNASMTSDLMSMSATYVAMHTVIWTAFFWLPLMITSVLIVNRKMRNAGAA